MLFLKNNYSLNFKSFSPFSTGRTPTFYLLPVHRGMNVIIDYKRTLEVIILLEPLLI